MAEPWFSTVEKLTEFFSADQIEASARRTKFVQRASKITGKLFVALVTFGRWSAAKTTVAQLAAKAAQLDAPVDITPEALQQRMTARAVAFLQELVQRAFTKLHTGDTICEDGIFTPFPRVHIADSRGVWLAREARQGISWGRRQWQSSWGEDSIGMGVQESYLADHFTCFEFARARYRLAAAPAKCRCLSHRLFLRLFQDGGSPSVDSSTGLTSTAQ